MRCVTRCVTRSEHAACHSPEAGALRRHLGVGGGLGRAAGQGGAGQVGAIPGNMTCHCISQTQTLLPYRRLVVLQTLAVGEPSPARPERPEEAGVASNDKENIHYPFKVLSLRPLHIHHTSHITCMTAPCPHQRTAGPGTRCWPHCSRWAATRRSRGSWRGLESGRG